MEIGYRRSVGSRIVRGTTVLVPTLVAFFCVLASILPYGSLGGVPISPLFPLAAIFFFILTRPAFMTPLSVFAIGIFQDLISGGPLGLWALVYLFVYLVTAAQRILFVGRPAGQAWLGFIFTCALTGVIVWFLATLFYQAYIPLIPIAGQMLVTALVYPLLAWVFTFFLPESEGGA